MKIEFHSDYRGFIVSTCWDGFVYYSLGFITFDLTDREQFLKACHYTNLQPLWAEDNFKKNRFYK